MKRFLCLSLLATVLSAGAQPVRFAVMADTHVGKAQAARNLRQAVRSINADTTLRFVLLLGDISHDGTARGHRKAHRILGRLNKPYYATTGNHDAKTPARYASFRRTFGEGRFSLECCGLHIVGLPTGPFEANRHATVSDDEAHEHAEGSGIGLMLTKDYARLHGGNIAVESAPGAGSRFCVTLPYRNGFSDVPASEDTPGANSGTSARETPRNDLPRLVVVEDNAEMLGFLKTALGSRYTVFTASDGEAGLDEIRRVCPDVVISDLMMPRMDGFELCRRLREDTLTSHIPFVMLTAKSNEADRAQSYNCGADAFFSKPFSIKTLTTRIEVLIESRAKLQELYRQKILSDPSDIEVESENDKFILRLVRIVEENLENPDFNIQMLCEDLECSYQWVYRKVKALTGETINDFMRTIKLKRAAQYLATGELRISEILYKSGFNSHSYFTKCFKERFGVTPKEYAEQFHAPDAKSSEKEGSGGS